MKTKGNQPEASPSAEQGSPSLEVNDEEELTLCAGYGVNRILHKQEGGGDRRHWTG